MANSNPPKKNQEFIFYISVEDFVNPGKWKTNPTLAAGDFKVSTDGAAEANPATLPSLVPASGRRIKVTLSAGEMNGDQVSFLWADQTAPQEWSDGGVSINTTA